MATRRGASTIALTAGSTIAGFACVGGKLEGEGPLRSGFCQIFPDARAGQERWEQAEIEMHKSALRLALRDAGRAARDVDLFFGGDLLNQCMATSFSLRDMDMPLAGLYGACSTFALALGMAALAIDGGGARRTMAAASSHFCSAEKQFRFPLEFGGQIPPSAQRTATAAGAVLLDAAPAAARRPIRVSAVTVGRVRDLGVTDANNMGAAMAPAACDTLCRFWADTGTEPADFDWILTGDLGQVGSRLLRELLQAELGPEKTAAFADAHRDGGLLLYDLDRQEVAAGGSGTGCSAAVLCAKVLPEMEAGRLRRVLFVGTGALLSVVSPLQGESIPGVAHAVELQAES
ncbi:MAG: stage V sporulation protein AD [Oscillospiraceae bacterium]|jgi:stage V sporulation protein AD|nr:stage V sporulation protein AD [Oscillospiraceae bacterium]